MMLRHIQAILLLHAFSATLARGHGFCEETHVKLHDGSWTRISTLARGIASPCVASYDNQYNRVGCGKIARGRRGTASCYLRISFDANPRDDVLCTLTQPLYTPLTQSWTEASGVRIGDCLLSMGGEWIPITPIELVRKPVEVYALEIEKTHTFYVGWHSVLVHNIDGAVAPTIGMYAYATASTLGCSTIIGTVAGVACGAAAFVACGLAVKGMLHAIRGKYDKRPTYKVEASSEPDSNVYAMANDDSARVVQAIEEAAHKEEKKPERPEKPMVYQVKGDHPPISLLKIGSCKGQFINARKSPCPPRIEGQAILSLLSLPTNSDRRIASFAGYFIDFRLHQETATEMLYHGFYLLQDPSSFPPGILDALRNNGILNGKHRIIKAIGSLL